MNASDLLGLAKQYEDNRDFITNEETAKMALVVPFIRLLGYDPNLPREVRLEYTAEFAQGDGKRFPDRMDFAIFDPTSTHPLIVIETKPLGTDLKSSAKQLARYISQLPELHFGIITDGCHYLFFGDLESPNRMDLEPFFSFALDDHETDWDKVAAFLSKFSREQFNAETLITDAENSRYRQKMVERLAAALQEPAADDGFLRWITDDIHKGKRTTAVLSRLAEIARDAVEPALLRVIGDDFLARLRERIMSTRAAETGGDAAKMARDKADEPVAPPDEEVASVDHAPDRELGVEEKALFDAVRGICTKAGIAPDEVLSKVTSNYVNVSYRRPTKWFVRLMVSTKRTTLVTLVPVEEAEKLCPKLEIEPAPSVFGVSRFAIARTEEVDAAKAVILRSLEIARTGKPDPAASEAVRS
jgi:hypothetical protein